MAAESARERGPRACGGTARDAQCVRELVKNPWGAEGWVCAECQTHLRGQAHTCRQCETAVCKQCWATLAANAARPAEIRWAEIPEAPAGADDRGQDAHAHLGVEALDFGALAFGGESGPPEGTQSARPVARGSSRWEETSSFLTARAAPSAPMATGPLQSARRFAAVPLAAGLAAPPSLGGGAPYVSEAPPPAPGPRSAARSGKTRRAQSQIESSLAAFVDVVENASHVDQAAAQKAWQHVVAARREAPNGPRDAALDAMITVTEYKIASERAARRKVERELKMARAQLSKALSFA